MLCAGVPSTPISGSRTRARASFGTEVAPGAGGGSRVDTLPPERGKVPDVAEKQRLTNKQRRAQARLERQRKQAEADRRRRRNQARNGLVTFAIVAVIAAVVLQAFFGGTRPIEDAIVLSAVEVEQAWSDAACETVALREPLPDRFHFEANQAPNPDSIYPEIRPTHSGPHTTGIHPVTASASRQISEVASTHNLEHGAIIVWWDPDRVDRADANAIGDWAERLNASGFRRDAGGVGILSTPYEDPGISSGKAVALRAWGTAVDCDAFDERVATAFVLEHFGTNGIGPERTLAPFPSELVTWDDDGPASVVAEGTGS
jgi:hypothetical protein